MSDFKIIGSTTPIVGKEEFYSVNEVLTSVLPYQNSGVASANPFEQTVEWSVHVLENSRWIKKEANNKKGNKVSFKFSQLSLERKGIRILAKRGEQTARLDVKPRNAEKPKIDSIELLDKSGNKPSVPLSYGQTLKARVHCLHMERRKIFVTLWEDDANGAGHNKSNEKNIIKTLSGNVKNGIADVDFLLSPSAAKIATKGDPKEGKIHEYYVTTDFDSKKLASYNLNVKELEAPVATYRARTATPRAPQHTEVRAAPTRTAPVAVNTTTTTLKGKITNVHITDTANRPITGVFKEKKLKVWIDSKELIGKDVRLRLYDHDNGSPNDLLADLTFPIRANIHAMVIALDTIPRSLGGNLLQEGAEQELFAEVEVFQTKTSSISEILKVDAKVFKQDQGEIINTVMKVFQPSAEEKKKVKGKCYCIKDFEEKDIRKLVKLLKGSETIWEGSALAGGKRAECNVIDKSFATLTKSLNISFKKYNINTCIQKIHFLAQVCEETGTFGLSEEITGQHASSRSIYKGRGLLQLTGVKKDGEELYDAPGPYKDYADYIGDQNIVKKPEVVANNAKYCIDSGAWIWSINKKMPHDAKSQAVKKWGAETAGKSLNELAVFGDKYLELISVLLNGRNKKNGNMPNGWLKRKGVYNLLKTTYFKYNWYHEDSSKSLIVKDVVAYHIYENGNIEKHIPKKIESGYEEKYKYIYHDKKDREHEICIVDFTSVQNWIVGSKEDGGVGWEKRTVGSKIRYYQKGNGQVELVKITLPINYNENDVVIKIGDNTDREYLNPLAFASMLGAVADCGYSDFIFNGSTSSDGTGAPSVTHVNGVSFDFRYLRKDQTGGNLHINTEPNSLDIEREEKFINALIKFGYSKFYSYNIIIDGDDFILKNSTHLADHHHHLHIRREGYKPKFKEIKE